MFLAFEIDTGGIIIYGIILAAGKGERMNQLTQVIPKALVSIAGKTLLEWSIDRLCSAGCSDIIVATGWKSNLVKKSLAVINTTSVLHFVEVPNYERGPLQTFVSAAELVHGQVSVLNPVDLIISSNAVISVIMHHSKDNPFAVTLAIDYSAPQGTEVSIDSNGHIIAIHNIKPNESQKAKSAMLLVFSQEIPSYCEDLLNHGASNIFSVLNSLVERKNSVFAHPITEKWYDIDTVKDALKANRHLLESICMQDSDSVFVPLGDSMEIGDNLSLDSDIFLGSGVHLKGPCFIQKNSRIEKNCIIGPYASLAEMTHIGSNSHVYDSSIFGHSKMPPHSKINNALVYQSEIYRMED